MKDLIKTKSNELCLHPLYARLNNLDNIRVFMQYHSFAVYDFMCLLKSLKNHLAMNDIFWKPTTYPQDIIRFVNEIIVGEESDLDQHGQATSHFMMYINSMKEVGANSNPVLDFIHSIHGSNFNTSKLPSGVKEFVNYNLELSLHGKIEEVAAAFLFGREKLVPEMFQSMTKVLLSQKEKYPSFFYYLERHIELDGEDHGPKAEKCLNAICGDDKAKWERAHQAAVKSLELRKKLWDECLKVLPA
jgi:hypothetical protein